MKAQEYKEKLIRFNSTEKYQAELSFLFRLLNAQSHHRILDYGCGTGETVWSLRNQLMSEKVFGYDVLNYRIRDNEFVFRTEYFFKFHRVYFMHSLAHIPRPSDAIRYLTENLLEDIKESTITVITPNARWLELQKKEGYTPDPTVVSHFDAESLPALFESAGLKIRMAGQFGSVTNGIHERLFLVAGL